MKAFLKTSDLVENYANDYETQITLLDELDQCFLGINAFNIFDVRFNFLLKYFSLNGDENLKKICNHMLSEIGMIKDLTKVRD